MRKLKKVVPIEETWKRLEFIIKYLKEKYGEETWHCGNNKKMENRYKEAIEEYEKQKNATV